MAVNQIHVDHIRRYLDAKLGPHIGLDDVAHFPEPRRDESRRSRSLAALAVQYLTECSETDAAMSVIDGQDDNGIDAIAFDIDAAHLYLVQAKWSEQGKASLTLDAAAKLNEGLRLITEHRHEVFNSRYQELREFVESVVNEPRFKVTVAFVLMGDSNIDAKAARPIADTVAELNAVHDCARISFLRLPDIHRLVVDGIHSRPVDLKIRMENSARVDHPHLAYYGCASADEIATWYGEHGDRLFDKNLRDALPGSAVNAGIQRTLDSEPENFWYFNNGITVLCNKIERSGHGALRNSGPADLLLEGASVVNGAQTVSTIWKAVQANPENAGTAMVWIRAIQLEDDRFAERVTETNNTQNAVDLRDFAAQDQTQRRLRDDFKSLELNYIIKRGDHRDLDPEKGFTIEDATIALAAGARDTDIVVDAHLDPNKLWQREDGGRYNQLFPSRIKEIRIWRTVRLYRLASRRIEERKANLEKRGRGFATNLGYLVIHVALRALLDERIENPDKNWERDVLPRVRDTTDRALDFMIDEADREYGNYFPASLANNYQKCRDLARAASAYLSTDAPAPVLPAEYLGNVAKPKNENAVRTIYSYEAIEPGTRLDFRARSDREAKLLNHWLSADPTRRFATWEHAKSKALKWEYDGQTYAATGLVDKIWFEATGKKRSAVQGTLYWFVAERGSLVDIADQIRKDLDNS
ncbi:AIPR family protein [Glycomyces paridis]|uniref:Abortive phage infection protein C-terminal domain-containing protein n=1 Tax=Glycomyces paridis TaxID=2126555 RepID=A0A4S8P366_9ACTN|nr:AIPR family protein [Glycomyces paridis]THV24487.1 hypothetical protein E9998_20955 [Glycomyces paridis]